MDIETIGGIVVAALGSAIVIAFIMYGLVAARFLGFREHFQDLDLTYSITARNDKCNRTHT